MSQKIAVAIIGYGNVGRGVQTALKQNPDMELMGIFSRSPERVKQDVQDVPVYSVDDLQALQKCSVAILCGGSKNDLPVQGPHFAAHISTVDSYDNHSCIPEYFNKMNPIARDNKTVSVISTGWDPGTFSLERVLGNAFLPGTKTYGFYGVSEKGGLSMGHSDALRTIEGVADARQYTHAIPEAIERVRRGENPDLKPEEMHWRECYVVLEDGADAEKIEKEITTMPAYFAPYKTEVHFISAEELKENHAGFPHGGMVIGSGSLGGTNRGTIEYHNTWDSNPAATANILVAHARAAHRLREEEKFGAYTIVDIPPAYFSPKSHDELLAEFL
ncbi:diaminopimelate dehydrogenase [Chitinivibrio alkaliphilus]|uniref:Meso-diaminopimelate D-dehydrogenase n=1 Tax=Chitinivibrio alkaliphilus ACht1 TaxID=1313304 RepID=U7DCU0_9BACT|nr:diaminopimelate dehydrogenase [Chitinivibrio alkaliphilus]ERP38716.1 diaminopimelate dehydrogenase [Chitinivibrio alkaliphilus ACht1]